MSDDQAEYQINDRMSFMRFLDLTLAYDVPDSKTVWNFREQLVDLDVIDELFNRFIKELGKLNLIINAGRIIDASLQKCPPSVIRKRKMRKLKTGEGQPHLIQTRM